MKLISTHISEQHQCTGAVLMRRMNRTELVRRGCNSHIAQHVRCGGPAVTAEINNGGLDSK